MWFLKRIWNWKFYYWWCSQVWREITWWYTWKHNTLDRIQQVSFYPNETPDAPLIHCQQCSSSICFKTYYLMIRDSKLATFLRMQSRQDHLRSILASWPKYCGQLPLKLCVWRKIKHLNSSALFGVHFYAVMSRNCNYPSHWQLS